MNKNKLLLMGLIYLMLSSCISGEVDKKNSNSEMEVIKLGLSASSSHNAQPWRIIKKENSSYTILSVKERWLTEVDPKNRELIISMGVLIATLDMAAEFLGWDFNFDLIANDPKDPVIGTFTLKKNNKEVNIKGINILKSIYSEKGNYNTNSIVSNLNYKMAKYFSLGSKEFKWLKESSIKANEKQAYKDNVQKELSDYFCFNKDDKNRGIGITPEMIRLPGIMLPIWYLFFDKEFIMSDSFRGGTASKVQTQIENSSGFFVLYSEDNSVKSLIGCGRNYQNILYDLRSKDIEVHPISQILEEDPWMNEIDNTLQSDKPVQMILRIGKYKKRELNYETDTITSASIRAPFETVYNN